MISTGEVFLILFLLILLGFAIFSFFIFYRQRDGLLKFKYTRGANATIPPGKDSVDVQLKCDGGKEICVYRATQICTSVGQTGYEQSPLDPMSDGSQSSGGAPYGDFNPNTTVDLTKKMGMECNGKGECTFKFTKDWNGVNGECKIGGRDLTTQLIATYTCYPPGSKEKGECQSWSPKTSRT